MGQSAQGRLAHFVAVSNRFVFTTKLLSFNKDQFSNSGNNNNTTTYQTYFGGCSISVFGKWYGTCNKPGTS